MEVDSNRRFGTAQRLGDLSRGPACEVTQSDGGTLLWRQLLKLCVQRFVVVWRLCRLLDHQVSDTTLRARRDEWIDAGVFDALKTEALAAYDRVIGFDLDNVSLDGSLHKAPYGGEGTGPNPTDRGKCGWKWSVASDMTGVPIGWAIDGANRHDVRMLEPTLDDVKSVGYFGDIGCLHLDRGYDSGAVRQRLVDAGVDEFTIQLRGTKDKTLKKQPVRLGLRWIVEATNSWMSNYGQLRRSTDRRSRHRHAALCLATTVLIIGRLLDFRDRWSPA